LFGSKADCDQEFLLLECGKPNSNLEVWMSNACDRCRSEGWPCVGKTARANGKISRCETCNRLHCSAARTKKKVMKNEDGPMVRVEAQSDGEEEEV